MDEMTNSEELLTALKATMSKRKKGRLKIFLGMAAGVGKTYSMLESAHKKVKEGVFLVVGTVNTHGRMETAALLEGLKIIPEKTVFYKDKEFTEFDLDAVLRLKPQLVIIDELAHTNVPGSRHVKRWQDVMEVLDAGIDVYTTLNIQHIESYKEIIESITDIHIWETVPDLVLEKATDITLVDITPTELLERLKEGKVYTGELTPIAVANFFQEDRLTALREISLRFAAEIVDQELHEMVSTVLRGKKWRPRERFLLLIDHNLYAQQLIRTTRRRAFTLHAPWIVLYVDDGSSLSDEEKAQLAKNFSLARELGAEVVTIKESDIITGIQKIAKQKGATQIIVGKATKKTFRGLYKASFVDKLLKKITDIDIHVIFLPYAFTGHKKKRRKKRVGEWISYFYILLWVAITTFVSLLIVPLIGYKVVGLVFFLTTLILTLFFKRGPLFLAIFVFAIIWDFLFIPPVSHFEIASVKDTILLILFLFTSLIAASVMSNVRKRLEILAKREASTQAIYEIVKEIASAPSSKLIFQGFKEKVGAILNGKCEVLIKSNGFPFEENPFIEDEKERAVANWVYEKGREAGWSTTTLPAVRNLYIPLKGFERTLGVVIFQPYVDKPLLPEESNFLYTATQQLANYLERSISEERERKNSYLKKVEKIYEKVFRTIAQELERPLKVIQEALQAMRTTKPVLDSPDAISALQKIEKAEKSLSRIVENATAMDKLSAGLISFEKSPQDIPSLIKACLKKVEPMLKLHKVKLSIKKELPLISCDPALLEILLNNLLMNAILYSPPDSTIEIEAETSDGTFALSVLDEGKGIPKDIMDLVFEKFYRVPGTTSTGLGLGLAIVKSIAELHQGLIRVQNRPTGGSKFTLLIPQT